MSSACDNLAEVPVWSKPPLSRAWSVEIARWFTQWAWLFKVCKHFPPAEMSQARMVLSWDASYIMFDPDHLTQETEFVWPLNVNRHTLRVVSQTLTQPSLDPDANRGRFPGVTKWSGSHVKSETHLECPDKADPNAAPSLASHSLMVLSIDPVAIIVPQGEYATQRTQLEWPESVLNGVWVLQSQILAVESPAPVHILPESLGAN